MSFSRRWLWLGLGLFLCPLLGCSTHQCTTCSYKPVTGSTSGCSTCSTPLVLKVIADPNGTPGTYVTVPRTTTLPETKGEAVKTPSSKGDVPAKVIPNAPLPLPGLKETPKVAPTTQLFPPISDGRAFVSTPTTTAPVASETQKPVREETATTARYDHAKDYTWLMGKLEYLHSQKAWRVRFAPPEVDDELGGCVTLLGADHLINNLQSGQMVRVDGVLTDPESRRLAPTYQVHALRPMD